MDGRMLTIFSLLSLTPSLQLSKKFPAFPVPNLSIEKDYDKDEVSE